MLRHIMIVQGHPDPAGGNICHALADAYADGAHEAGHQVGRIDVASLDFPFLRSLTDPELPEALVTAKAALLAADHIVVVLPYWFGFIPAPLKAFFQQIMHPHLPFHHEETPSMQLFQGRSARIVVALGEPVRLFLVRDPNEIGRLRRDMSRAGIAPIRVSRFGMLRMFGVADKPKWLERMHELGAHAW